MNTVRITGGKYKGRIIDTPGGNTHPMGERERIALFNMLGDRIENAYVMDAYAGGGTLGIEALSRGAEDVMFIEKNQHACDIMWQNGEKLKIPDGIAPFCGKVREFLPIITDRFDVVMMDPPYNEFEPHMIDELRPVVALGGLLVVSHPGELTEIDGLTILQSKKYAGAHITIYKRNEDDR